MRWRYSIFLFLSGNRGLPLQRLRSQTVPGKSSAGSSSTRALFNLEVCSPLNTVEFTLVVAIMIFRRDAGVADRAGGGVVICAADFRAGVDIRYAIGASLVSVIAENYVRAAAAYCGKRVFEYAGGSVSEVAKRRWGRWAGVIWGCDDLSVTRYYRLVLYSAYTSG